MLAVFALASAVQAAPVMRHLTKRSPQPKPLDFLPGGLPLLPASALADLAGPLPFGSPFGLGGPLAQAPKAKGVEFEAFVLLG